MARAPAMAVAGPGLRGSVDTSSPIGSVKEAVSLFGGAASPWSPKPTQLHLRPEEMEQIKVEENIVKLEMDLFVKERETLKVLQELEMTKKTIDGLKSQLEKQVLGGLVTSSSISVDRSKAHSVPDGEEKCATPSNDRTGQGVNHCSTKCTPGATLLQLKQAKMYLNRANAQHLKVKIDEEKLSSQKIRERIVSNNALAACLRQELEKTLSELHTIKDLKLKECHNSLCLDAKMKQLNAEKERFRQMTDISKQEISQLILDIEQTKSRTKTVEIRMLIANKMKEASQRAEALALLERKALEECQESRAATSHVVLSLDEYATLTSNAQQADANAARKVQTAMLELEEAKKSRSELLQKVDEAVSEVKAKKKALHEACKREEAANEAKIAAEETLLRLRAARNLNKRGFLNDVSFKTSAAAPLKAGSELFDVNGRSLVVHGTRTLSIGQILSRKLMAREDIEAQRRGKVTNTKPRISLAHVLTQSFDFPSPSRMDDGSSHKHFSSRRKKFESAILSLLLAKQRRKKKHEPAFNPRSSFTAKAT